MTSKLTCTPASLPGIAQSLALLQRDDWVFRTVQDQQRRIVFVDILDRAGQPGQFAPLRRRPAEELRKVGIRPRGVLWVEAVSKLSSCQ